MKRFPGLIILLAIVVAVVVGRSIDTDDPMIEQQISAEEALVSNPDIVEAYLMMERLDGTMCPNCHSVRQQGSTIYSAPPAGAGHEAISQRILLPWPTAIIWQPRERSSEETEEQILARTNHIPANLEKCGIGVPWTLDPADLT